MSTKDEEDAWRSIVENYGDRVRLGDDLDARERPDGPAAPEVSTTPPATPAGPATPGTPAGPLPPPERFVPFEGLAGLPASSPDAAAAEESEDDEARFVPETPPLPYVPPRRLAAWSALVLAPLALLVCGALDWYVPTPLRALLVVAPLVGFGYLVATMSRDPRDPYDDGARV